MTKTEFIEKAKELDAKIELIVEVDVNDADYIHEIQEYSVEEFEKYNIFDDYVKLKTLEQRRGLWYIIAQKAFDRWDDRDEYFYGKTKLTVQDEEFIKDYDKYCDYIPYNVCCEGVPPHTIESVSLRLIIPFED